MSDYKPDYLVSPGEVIWDYIENLYGKCTGITEVFSGCDLGLLVKIEDASHNCYPITPAIAIKLEKLGRPAHFWLNLERQYQEDRRRLSGISPWRKVEDEPPPKDGSEFLVKYEDGEYQPHKWDKSLKGGKGYFIDPDGLVCDEFLSGIKWMLIPGGEE